MSQRDQPSAPSTTSWPEPEIVKSGSSGLSERFRTDRGLRYSLERDVAGELAEQLIRLRHYRGLTQRQLAERVGTAQPAIARHESAISNMRCSTLEVLLKALRGVVRVELIPAEHDELLRRVPRWWKILDTVARASASAEYTWTMISAPTPRQLTDNEPLLLGDGVALGHRNEVEPMFAAWFTGT